MKDLGQGQTENELTAPQRDQFYWSQQCVVGMGLKESGVGKFALQKSNLW